MKTSFITDRDGKNIDNYEVVCDRWRQIYQKMDHRELRERFHLKYDEAAAYIIYYNEEYRLDEETGMLTLASDPERKLAFNTVIAIYNLFYYAKKDAKVRGEFVPYRQVKRAAPFAPAFQRTIVNPLAKRFNGHPEALERACKALNGTPVRQGDVGYRIQAFDCIPVEVYFWDGDEEFEAQANILFDADITDFLHEETVCCIGADVVRRLAEESGLGEAEDLLGSLI